MTYPTQNGDCPLPCGCKTPNGKCGVTACVHWNVCSKCGRQYQMYYNAGMPVFGCEWCSKHAKIEYSDHTEPLRDET